MNQNIYIAAAFALWNLITFSLYGIDKHKARANKWRISETTLIGCAFLMGGLGAFLGMRTFRHKTKHLKFRLLIPLAALANIGIVLFLLHRHLGGT